jgi:acetolactate synthase-1/2/3 large subunit
LPTNAQAIAHALAEAGVTYAFGHPGGEVVPLIDACRAAGVRFYLMGHEASAAFAAEVTGQLTGRPGVCISTLGPGAMNLSLGLSNALLDRGPVLALTAQVPTTIARHFPHQRLPLDEIFGGFCKFSGVLDGAGTEDVVRDAIQLALAPHPGPVHLALPSNLSIVDSASGPSSLRVRSPRRSRVSRPLTEVASALRAAKRPLLAVGVGCAATDVPALRAFVDRTRIPYVVTPKAKGLLPEDAPGFLGVISGMAIDKQVMETVDAADLIFGVGFDPVECDRAWYVGRAVTNLSRASTAEGDYHPIESVGDVARSLRALAKDVGPGTWPADLVAEARSRLAVSPMPGDGGLSPLLFLDGLREALPREAVLTCDVGSHKYFCGQFWRAHEPQTFWMSNGLSAMGYGVPAAIAAQLHFPQRTVVAVVGDGGMLMMLHNLNFLRQYQVPVVIVVLADASLSLIRISQARRHFMNYGVDFPDPDFAGIARSFDLHGVIATSVPHAVGAVEEALRARRPAVVHVPIDRREYEAYC